MLEFFRSLSLEQLLARAEMRLRCATLGIGDPLVCELEVHEIRDEIIRRRDAGLVPS